MAQPTNIFLRMRPPGALWLWSVRGLALAALLVATYLTFISVTDEARPAGCGPESACAEVLSSHWSKWMKVIPVSSLAIVLYAVVLAATVFLEPKSSGQQRRRGWILLTVGAVMILGAVVWFVCLQIFAIDGLCPWCMGAHLLGMALSCLILLLAPFGLGRFKSERSDRDIIAAPVAGILVAAGLLGVAMFVMGQVLMKPTPASRWLAVDTQQALPPVNRSQSNPQSGAVPSPGPVTPRLDIVAPENTEGTTPPRPAVPHPAPNTSKRRVWFYNKSFFIELPLPLLGSPDAEHLILDLFDYRCMGCRRMHKSVTEARRRLGAKVAFVAFPVPLDSHCNPEVKKTHPYFEQSCELARLALAVWSANPDAFAAMHRWLFEGDDPPDAADARAFAVQLVGEQPLAAALTDPWIDEQILSHVRVHKFTYGKDKQYANLPKLISQTTLVAGVPEDADVLVKHLGKTFGIEPMELKEGLP